MLGTSSSNWRSKEIPYQPALSIEQKANRMSKNWRDRDITTPAAEVFLPGTIIFIKRASEGPVSASYEIDTYSGERKTCAPECLGHRAIVLRQRLEYTEVAMVTSFQGITPEEKKAQSYRYNVRHSILLSDNTESQATAEREPSLFLACGILEKSVYVRYDKRLGFHSNGLRIFVPKGGYSQQRGRINLESYKTLFDLLRLDGDYKELYLGEQTLLGHPTTTTTNARASETE